MWDNVLKNFRDTLDKAEASYLAKATSELTNLALFDAAPG